MYDLNLAKHLSQACVHCATDLVSLLTHHKNVWSSNSCMVQELQNNLWAYLWEFSYGFQFFFFEMMVINAWSRYFIELLCRLVCQVTISLHSFLRMTFQITRPWRITKIHREWKFLSSHRGSSRFKRGSVIVHNICAYFTLSLSATQVHMIKERCWFSQIDFFIEYFPHRIKILFLSSKLVLCHPHSQIRIILFSRCTNIIQARTGDFAQLLCRLVCQLAISLNTFLSESFHVIGPRNCFCVRFSPP